MTTRSDFEATHNLSFRPRQVTPINVECSTDEDLALIAEHPAVHADVQRMAVLTAMARIERLSGSVAMALKIEGKVDRLYETLPRHLRW